jgi:hypothetical protein
VTIKNIQPSRETVEKIDGRIALFALKLAHPRPVNAGVRRESLL